MSDSERAEVVAFVGANPEAGAIIPEAGGVRKIRWALEGMGTRGGARVIYYYHNEQSRTSCSMARGRIRSTTSWSARSMTSDARSGT